MVDVDVTFTFGKKKIDYTFHPTRYKSNGSIHYFGSTQEVEGQKMGLLVQLEGVYPWGLVLYRSFLTRITIYSKKTHEDKDLEQIFAQIDNIPFSSRAVNLERLLPISSWSVAQRIRDVDVRLYEGILQELQSYF